MKAPTLSLTPGLLCLVSGLTAAPVDSHIAAVTVYADRAVVTRTATATLPVGQSEIVFEKLPADLADQSLQVAGRGTAHATILDVNSRLTYVDATPDPRAKAIEDDIKNLQGQLRTYTDRATVLKDQRDLLKRITNAVTTPIPTPRDGTPAARPGIDEWQKLMAFSDESLAKLLAEQQSLDDSQEHLQAKISALEAQLNELNGRQPTRQSYKTVTVHVAATEAGNLDTTLAYTVPGASWTPAYDARLHSDERAVELTYFGIVHQNTGEDWKDIALTLSTARPSLGGAAPELEPWIVDIRQPRHAGEDTLTLSPFQVRAERDKGYVASESMSGTKIMPPAAPLPASLSLATIDSAATSASFKIPTAATVLSDNTPQKVGITTASLAAKLQYQSTPRASETAFLSAYTTNTTDYPLLTGIMNTFLDDTFIASSSLKTVMPGEKLELALGADEGIAIKRKLVNRFTENTGLTGSGRRITYDILFTVQNNKKTAERVVFKDTVPVSRNEKIEVSLIAPAEKDLGTPDKVREVTREADSKLVWRLDLKPGEKRELPLKFTVEYPGDLAVSGLE